MTREETIKVLAILKAAYPNSYKGMTKDEANGVITVWSVHFSNIPLNIVMIAINKIISASKFPPTISDVRDALRGLYYEAAVMLRQHEDATTPFKWNPDDPNEEPEYWGTPLDEKTLATVKEIIKITSPMRGEQNAVSLQEMLQSGGGMLIEDKKRE